MTRLVSSGTKIEQLDGLRLPLPRDKLTVDMFGVKP
jgi:hypothetical protein